MLLDQFVNNQYNIIDHGMHNKLLSINYNTNNFTMHVQTEVMPIYTVPSIKVYTFLILCFTIYC